MSLSLQPRLVVERMTTASHDELSCAFGEAELSASFLQVALGHEHRAFGFVAAKFMTLP